METYLLKLASWRSAQVGLPFRRRALGHFVRGAVPYWLLCGPCEYGVPIHTPLQVVLWQKTRRPPDVFRPHTDLFSAVISLLLCVGVEFICVVLFVPVNKNLIQFHLDSSALFRVLFSCEVITVCALAFPVVFGRSFWLLHLISVKVKRSLTTS